MQQILVQNLRHGGLNFYLQLTDALSVCHKRRRSSQNLVDRWALFFKDIPKHYIESYIGVLVAIRFICAGLH